MEILEILLDILLKPPQPLMGLFLVIRVPCSSGGGSKGYLGVWGVPTHAHAVILKYTCTEIVNGHLHGYHV